MSSTSERDKAAEIQRRYSEQLQQIREARDLSDEGRRRQLAAAYASTRKQLDSLRKQEQERVAKRAGELEWQVFGPVRTASGTASDAISVRDAQDRAARISKPAEARELLRRAEQNNDEVLARAIAQTALDRGRQAAIKQEVDAWDETLGAFYDARPHLSGVLQEQSELERLARPELIGPYSITRPTEVPSSALNSLDVPDTSEPVARLFSAESPSAHAQRVESLSAS